MSKYIPGNQKHLTLDDRIYIENALNRGCSFKDIARYLCKDPSTISKEIRAHQVSDWYHKGTFYNAHNFCIHRYHCQKTNVCDKIVLCGIKCASCPTCNQTCPDFEKERCARLNRAPYVCNGCDKQISHCTIAQKYRYDAKFADRKYRETLSGAREGINLSKGDLHRIDMIVSPLIDRGTFPLSDHREPVRVRWPYLSEFRGTGARFLRGDGYPPFLPGIQKGPADLFLCEGKAVPGLPHEPLHERIRPSRARPSGKRLGTECFLSLFGYLLTDRGSEFGDPESLETGIYGIERTSIYYCDPMRSGQKGGVENAHTMLRMILPKGTSFAFLTQWDVNLITSHINSTPRESLGGKAPYEAASESLGDEILRAFQLMPVPPDEVNLTPKLIRCNH